MTVLENSIRIDATPERVWSVLASLDALAKYDPGVSKSRSSRRPRTVRERPGGAT
jgi:carbon monoxide dehydrogenase subunit G